MVQHLSHPEHEGQMERSVPACFTKANKEPETQLALHRPWLSILPRPVNGRPWPLLLQGSAFRLRQPPPTSSPLKEPDRVSSKPERRVTKSAAKAPVEPSENTKDGQYLQGTWHLFFKY